MKNNNEKQVFGEIHKKGSLFLREELGSVVSPSGEKYVVAISASTKLPLIMSEKTGKWFSLKWENIADLAIDAGIDEEEPQPDPEGPKAA